MARVEHRHGEKVVDRNQSRDFFAIRIGIDPDGIARRGNGGMILRGGVVADRMRGLGWLWGARWAHPDYQHFSSNGG